MPRLALQPRRIVYLVLGIAALYLGDHLGLTTWGTALLFSPILVIEALLRLRVRAVLPRFRATMLDRLQANAAPQELLDLYQAQTFLRFAAPGHEMLSWLARIHGHSGQHKLAAQAYERALEEAPRDKAPLLALSLGDCLYEVGEMERAEQTYREALTEEHRSSRACANLARIIIKRGGDREEAEGYLQLAVEGDRGGELRLEYSELLLELERPDDARWQLDLAAEELEAADAGEAALDKLKALQERLTQDL
jgi:tetratricopeptide (TPR) repeat protein